MSIDSPDNSRAIVAAQILLGAFPQATTTATIPLPDTVTALWVWSGDSSSPMSLTVQGVTTGRFYPVYAFETGSTNEGQTVPVIALVSPVLDQAVILDWHANADTDPWYVVGDTGLRVTASLPLFVASPV